MPAPKGPKAPCVYGRDLLTLPPGTMGYSSLVEPDEYDGKKKFKLRVHYTPAAFALIEKRVQESCMDALVDKFADKAEEVGAASKLKDPVDVGVWLEEKQKAPSEKSRVQLPFLSIEVMSTKKNKAGDDEPRFIKAWDKDNNLLNLAKLRLGSGSIVQPIVTPFLWASQLSKWRVTPGLQLVGLRVLKLEQYGGTGGLGDLTDEDTAVLEQDFEPEVLSGYAQSQNKPAPDEEDPHKDEPGIEDEIPF